MASLSGADLSDPRLSEDDAKEATAADLDTILKDWKSCYLKMSDQVFAAIHKYKTDCEGLSERRSASILWLGSQFPGAAHEIEKEPWRMIPASSVIDVRAGTRFSFSPARPTNKGAGSPPTIVVVRDAPQVKPETRYFGPSSQVLV